jgi:transcriptional regulator with XRE-family HTH domain
MNDRIKKFIDFKSISPSELADRLNVQRSNVSHILNGRNKPGANFIEKILSEFPEINARWLLTGSGEMLITKKEQVKTLFDQSELQEAVRQIVPESPLIRQEASLKDIKPVEIERDYKKRDKTVERVMVFYTDKTFSEYLPS